MFGNMNNSPPIVEYEQVVRPVAVTTRGAPLSRRDRRGQSQSRSRRNKPGKNEQDFEDILFEPFIGKLFDFTA